MTHEVSCGRCGGRFRVEPHTGHVACPHCDATLSVPEETAVLAAASTLATVETAGHVAEASSIFDSAVLRSGDAGGPIAVPSSIKAPDFTRWGKSDSFAMKGEPAKTNPLAGEAMHAGEHVESPAVVAKEKEVPNPDVVRQAPLRTADAALIKESAKSGPVSKMAPAAGASRGTLFALMIYASAVTAVCLGLAYFLLTNRQHQLESLPDIVPPMNDDGTITHILVPPDAALPPGHVLKLGESRRFGDVFVTAVKMTREPLNFVHFLGEETREPAGEVLKLWLKFENVGDGKAFSPLDENLLFYRTFDTDKNDRLKANNFLAPADRSPGQLVPIFDQPIGSDWDLAGQSLGAVLEPGESVEMYVPTETDPPEIDGPTVWRLHIRKGIASNGWGVTTLIEVVASG
jgi:hypothetical protein